MIYRVETCDHWVHLQCMDGTVGAMMVCPLCNAIGNGRQCRVAIMWALAHEGPAEIVPQVELDIVPGGDGVSLPEDLILPPTLPTPPNPPPPAPSPPPPGPSPPPPPLSPINSVVSSDDEEDWRPIPLRRVGRNAPPSKSGVRRNPSHPVNANTARSQKKRLADKQKGDMFACGACGKMCNRKDNLKRHMNRAHPG
jgi:hypothetical protein